jgi:GNAT superfamily N-acetyltransferase
MAPSEPIIGAALTAAELSYAEALVREAGWNQVAADWEIFRALGTVFAARVGNHVVATAAILPYGQFAWISMVLVAGEQRRRNLGTRLLKRCIDALREQGCVPVLDATPAGRPLYRLRGDLGLSPVGARQCNAAARDFTYGRRHDCSPDRRRGLARIVRL